MPYSILLIEDDPGIQELIQAELENDFLLHTAENGEKALHMMQSASYDLLLLDYSLPDTNGRQFIDTLKKNKLHVPPFIVTTGVGDERIAVDMMKNGAADYIVKDNLFLELLPVAVLKIFDELNTREQLARSRQALLESEEKYKMLVENIRDVVWQVDTNYIHTYISPSDINLRGYTPEEVIGKSVFEFLTPPSLQYFHDVIMQRKKDIMNGIPVKSGTFSLEQKCKNGSAIWTEVVSTPYFDKDGKLLYFQGIMRDISERKAAEHERLEMERRLLHAQKLESLGVLAGGIAHDFNNLLMSIIGNLDLAKLYLPEHSQANINIECSMQASMKAADLIKQMLAYSGKGKFIIKHICLNTIIEENSKLLKVSIGKNAVLNLHLSDIPFINADPAQIQQIIMNLITNASEAIGEKSGAITIRTGKEFLDTPTLSHSLCEEHPQPGEFVFIEVEDTGCGMNTATIHKLFDPFFTTKFTGRGLGMSAVLGIVRGHKGAIFVDSILDKGSTIKICFPAEKNEQGQIIHETEYVSSETKYDFPLNRSILFVDDELTVRNVCIEILKHLGFSVFPACDGQEALAVLAQNPYIPLCLIDYSMPGMNGVETARALIKINPELKILLSSGYNESVALKEESCIHGFIQKPFKVNEIRQAISEITKNN